MLVYFPHKKKAKSPFFTILIYNKWDSKDNKSIKTITKWHENEIG